MNTKTNYHKSAKGISQKTTSPLFNQQADSNEPAINKLNILQIKFLYYDPLNIWLLGATNDNQQ